MSRKRPAKSEVSMVETALSNEIREATTEIESRELLTKKSFHIASALENLSADELTRFEFYVRSHLARKDVKELMAKTLGKDVDDEMAIVVSGLTKLFIGELCDHAVDAVNESGLTTGILPSHVREAYRRMNTEGKVGRQPDVYHPFIRTPQSKFAVIDDIMDNSQHET